MLLLLIAGLVVTAPARAAAQDDLVVVAFGDSLTAGYNIGAEEAFPARLEAALRDRGYPVRVVNAGVSGDTTAGGLARLDWMLADAPDVVIVELGANDALRGMDPALTEANLDAILTRLRAEDIDVLLAGMLAPPNLGPAYAQAYNSLFPRLAERHDVPLYPFFLDGVIGVGDRSLLLADGMHPSPSGVDVIVRRILPAASAVVEQALVRRETAAATR